MLKKILIITMVIFTASACSVDDDSSNFTIETLPIKEAIVPDFFDFGQVYEITVFFDLPDGCHSFYDLFYRHDGTARIVAINSLVDNESACTLAVIENQFTFTVRAVQQEDYTFKFWKGTDSNGDDIFEEVIVPVNL